jgi:hypothetical protein
MTRWRATALHLAISIAVAALLVALFTRVWYPAPLLQAGGGARLLALLLIVLFITGPLLTLILFRPGKRGLRFDMVVVGLLQALALLAGLFVAAGARPAYIAVLPLRATLVRAGELYRDPSPASDYARAPWWGPRMVAVVDPATAKERDRLLDEVLSGLPDIDYRPAYYRPLGEHLPELIRQAAPLSQRIDEDPALAPHYAARLAARGYAAADGLRYYTLIAPNGELDLVLDPARQSIIGIAPSP